MSESSALASDATRVVPSVRASQLAVASLFGALGFGYGTWTSRLPAIKASLGLSTSQVSVVLLSAAIGSVLSFPVTAAALHKLGSRGASVLAGCLLAAGLVALGLAPSWMLACIVMCLYGVIASTMDVAMNAQGVEVERATAVPVMSRLHAVFSLGTMAGAFLASSIVGFTTSVPVHFAVAALVVLAATLLPRAGLVADANAIDGGTRSFALPRGAALLIGAMAFLGMIVEGSMVDWSTLYLKERAAASQQVAPLGIASLQGAMLVTRWFGDRARVRWGARRLLFGGSLLAGLSLAAALLIGGVWPALVGFGLFGIGVATVSPCVYAAGAREGGVALAAVMTLGSLGFLVGPLVIGAVAQATNLSWGMAVVAASAIALAALSRRVRWD
ncbi:MFS transporter [Scleromatobacter humisilvae]|uniref:MFS transporter n=1 Tax=Scleromatobacter humisilvae TaxID=2897159 RepID=A0A9X1YF65_9BURK|nr:MFS transporter [Scleromatobacter humisilvae]MCK9684522.1 MFS transporter [Scleromatobacter humisilvae]